MSFKLKGAPYNKDNMNIAVYRKDLTDGSAGKSNHTGIIVDKDVSPEMEKAVIAHEKVHQEQQKKGELDYDENNFYWKGKVYPRENLNEHNENLPWEKEAYKVSNSMMNNKNNDMKQRFQLKGYRGNNKPFAAMSKRGLIGDAEGASAEMCMPGGGDDPVKCKGSTKAYDKIQGKKRKTKRVRKPKSRDSKFVYTTDNLKIDRAPQTIKNQPDYAVEHNISDSKGKLAPTINIPSVKNVSDDTKKEIKSRPTKTQDIINKGVSKDMGGQGQNLSTPGSESGIYSGSRYKKVKRKNSSGNKVTRFKQKGSYTIDASDPDGKKTLTYTKGKNRVKTISSDSKRYENKVKRVTGKIRKNAAAGGSDDKFVSKRSKMII